MNDVVINGMPVREGAPHILSVSFLGIRSEVLLHTLEDRNIYVSAGSACSSHKRKPSATLSAMGMSNAQIENTVRISFSEENTFEEVDYWDELTKIMDWTNTHVTSTMFLCWGAQASLYHFYGLKKRMLPEKKFGLFWHKVNNRKIPLVRGFDDEFLAPHSRHTEVPIDDIRACKDVTILAESDEAGFYLGMAEEGRKIFVMGHPEYDRMTLDGEYHRDKDKGLPIEIPKNYYKNDDPNTKPVLLWRSHANNLYTNWLNYYVYQVTPYNLDGTPDFSGK